jgi:hypothetical protein
MVSAMAALMAAIMVVMAAPAMAIDFDFDNHDDNDFNKFHFKDHDDDDDFDNFRGFNDFGNLGVDNEAESGPVDQEFSVTNTGDYASQCVPALQFGNSGNFNNAPTFAQFGSGGFFDDDNDRRNHFGFFDNDNDRRNHFGFFNDGGIGDFEPGGIEFSVSPEVAVDCSNTIQQSSAASSTPYYYWR